MSQRRHAEDEVQQAGPRHAEERPEDASVTAATLFDAATRGETASRGSRSAVAQAIGGLQADAGNGAVAWLLRGSGAGRARDRQPEVRAGVAAAGGAPMVQREGDDEEATATNEFTGGSGDAAEGTPATTGGDEATPLGAGAPPANPSWTKVGPPTPGSYAVSGSLRTVATAIGARPEAGSVTVAPSWQPQTWTPDGGTEEVISAQVKVGQVVELPVWSDKSSATKNQQAEWDRFHAAITTHEAGHVAKDVAAFKGVHSKMLKKTESDADKELDTVIALAKTANTDYDTATASGISQGTGINPNIDEVTKVP